MREANVQCDRGRSDSLFARGRGRGHGRRINQAAGKERLDLASAAQPPRVCARALVSPIGAAAGSAPGQCRLANPGPAAASGSQRGRLTCRWHEICAEGRNAPRDPDSPVAARMHPSSAAAAVDYS